MRGHGDRCKNLLLMQLIKQEISSETVLVHYDPNKESLISADSSSFGLGGLLRQKHGETWKSVAVAFRFLSDTECRYAQIEKEILAVTWACANVCKLFDKQVASH